MKIRNIAIGVVVGGVIFVGGVAAEAWQKGLSVRETVELGAGVIAAKADGRTNLGGDIMIHGSNATIGCVPIGDKAIEDIFYLVAKVGFKNVEIVIAPYDMRKGRRPELEESSLAWYPRLCDDICAALNKGYSGGPKVAK